MENDTKFFSLFGSVKQLLTTPLNKKTNICTPEYYFDASQELILPLKSLDFRNEWTNIFTIGIHCILGFKIYNPNNTDQAT